MFQFLLDCIFPSFCLGCGTYLRGGAVFCAACAARVPVHDALFCGKCRARVPGDRLCHRSFPYLLGAATDYGEESVRNLITALKFKSVRAAGTPLGDILVRYAKTVPLPEGAVVIPIPLGPRRERERGFNQSLLLARAVADALALPLLPNILRRVRNTPPQSGLADAAERRANVARCFVAENAGLVRRANIILIDDVVTSGATLIEAAGALKAAGAAQVVALAVAKA